MKLTMLQPRVQTLRVATVRPLAVERTRGSAWMATRERILRRDHGVCQCDECQAQPAPLIAHEVDHIVELADGGSDADSNLRAINHECHVRKTAEARRQRGQTR
jgi:5-methylcytosine-specific restriction protein A